MKEKELSVAEKTRKTKLSKKNVDELVSIILRKDDVERKNSKLIKCLKINVDSLEKKNKLLQKDYQELEDVNVGISKSFEELHKVYKETNDKLKDSLNAIQHYDDDIFSLQDKINKLVKSNARCFGYGLLVGAVIIFIIELMF